MGLLDKVFGGNQRRKDTESLAVNAPGALSQGTSEIEAALAERGSVDLRNLKKVPLAEVAALGGAFAQAVPMLKSALTGGKLTNGSLARVVFPEGVKGELNFVKSEGMYIGSIHKSGGGLAQSRLKPIAMDPAVITTLGMAAMMVQVNQKLDEIQQMQKEILSFLQEKERAENQASLNMLEDILKRYPYNWNNDTFRCNYHLKILDIKQASDARLIHYQKQIAEKIKGLPAVYLDQALRDGASQLQKLFHDYCMSLYVFSFASYLEIMLDGRFVDEDMGLVADKVHAYQESYRTSLQKCQEYFKKFSGGSIESLAVGVLAGASKGLGKLIGSSSVLSKGQVDEWLQESGEKLQRGMDQKAEKIGQVLAVEQNTGGVLFEELIRNAQTISNHLGGLVFDEDFVYLVA